MKLLTLLVIFIALFGMPLMADDSSQNATEITARYILNDDGRDTIASHRGDLIMLEIFAST